MGDILLTGTAGGNYELAPGVTANAAVRASILPCEIAGIPLVCFARNGDVVSNRSYDPGDTISITADAITPAEAASSMTYEWFRVSDAGVASVGRGETYTISQQDVGGELYAVGTAAMNYTGSVTSDTVSIGSECSPAA